MKPTRPAGRRRIHTAVRLDPEEITRINALALEHGVTKGNGDPNLSEMARSMLALVRQMPEGWTWAAQ